MRAFVLSGGGRLGPMQVGALRALLEHGVRPEMIVGCSVGALNAAYLARDISPNNLEDLATTWRSVSSQDIYPGSRVNSMWRLLRGYDSLHDNRRFYGFLAQRGMTPALTFGNCSENVRLFVTATHLNSGTLHVFGDDPNERVIDGLMASTALTPMHPPWTVDGERYVDGGAVTPLPIRVAVERGATEVYALQITESLNGSTRAQQLRGVGNVLSHTVSTMFKVQAEQDLLLAQQGQTIQLHHIELSVDDPPELMDYSQADRLMDAGYKTTLAYLLQAGMPLRNEVESQSWWSRVSGRVRRALPEPASSDLLSQSLLGRQVARVNSSRSA